MSERYNGYTNYETWLVAVHMDNDPYDQQYWLDAARETYGQATDTTESGLKFTREINARLTLEERLRDAYDAALEELKLRQGVFSDLLAAAMGSVNWRELAGNLIDSIVEEESNA